MLEVHYAYAIRNKKILIMSVANLIVIGKLNKDNIKF